MVNIRNRLVRDLKSLGLPIEEVDFRTPKYSKKYYGFYVIKYPDSNFDKPRLYVYLCEDKAGKKVYDYSFLLDTAIHEMCHHLQWRNPNYVRYLHIMHDDEFKRYYDYYIYKAKLIGVLEDDYESEAA